MDVPGLPVSVLLDRDGNEIARLMGGADWNGPDARAIIDAADRGGLAGRRPPIRTILRPGGFHPRQEGIPMTTFKVGYLIGSLATASINRKLARRSCGSPPTSSR